MNNRTYNRIKVNDEEANKIQDALGVSREDFLAFLAFNASPDIEEETRARGREVDARIQEAYKALPVDEKENIRDSIREMIDKACEDMISTKEELEAKLQEALEKRAR